VAAKSAVPERTDQCSRQQSAQKDTEEK